MYPKYKGMDPYLNKGMWFQSRLLSCYFFMEKIGNWKLNWMGKINSSKQCPLIF